MACRAILGAKPVHSGTQSARPRSVEIRDLYHPHPFNVTGVGVGWSTRHRRRGEQRENTLVQPRPAPNPRSKSKPAGPPTTTGSRPATHWSTSTPSCTALVHTAPGLTGSGPTGSASANPGAPRLIRPSNPTIRQAPARHRVPLTPPNLMGDLSTWRPAVGRTTPTARRRRRPPDPGRSPDPTTRAADARHGFRRTTGGQG